MEFTVYLPFWNQLTSSQQLEIQKEISFRKAKKGTLFYNGQEECLGLLLIRQGQLRAFLLSPEGREITLYRLFPGDLCLFSASCMMRSIQFELSIEAEKDTEFWLIPAERYKKLCESSAPAPNYINEVMSSRFTEVMWRMEQIMWKSLDKRLAAFLLEEAAIEGSNELKITHEAIANHMGSHREVITRMLRYFQGEGLVRLSRGMVAILDEERLKGLAGTDT